MREQILERLARLSIPVENASPNTMEAVVEAAMVLHITNTEMLYETCFERAVLTQNLKPGKPHGIREAGG